jgi:flagellar M-ring protein FliF
MADSIALSESSMAVVDSPLRRLAAAPARTKVMLALGVLAIIAVLTSATMWSNRPDFKPLFVNLADKDGGAVIAALNQLNIPYRTEGGNTVLVPADKLHDAKFKLAALGLPKGSSIDGLELFDNQKFGATQFQEQMNFQRGMQGELARTIQTINVVKSASVLLSIPKQSVFLRDAQKPSAAVTLGLYPGKTLDPSQIAGIVHLVASSVPGLTPRNVSVIDQNIGLLTKNDEASASGLDPSQLDYVKKIEQQTSSRIASILEPIVGMDNYRVQVTADVDFSQSEQSSESYKPNTDPKETALRSQQISESSAKTAEAGGVPGALTNQPAAQATAPIGQNADPKQAAAQAQANGETRKESIANYEVDKTTRVVHGATGLIKRISAAVVLNHRNTKDADGVVTSTPLTAQEIEQINALVREAMGFTKERGDTLNVTNVPFTAVTLPEATDTPIWKDPANIDMAKEAAKWLGLLVIAMVVMKGFIKPAIDAMKTPIPTETHGAGQTHLLSTTVGPDDDELASLPAPGISTLDQVRELAKNDPRAVANVVKNWVAKE